MKIKENIIVLILALVVGVFVAIDWDVLMLKQISSGLFSFFIPGISVVVFLSGGFHQASEIHVVIGVALQIILLWWMIQIVYRAINKKKDT